MTSARQPDAAVGTVLRRLALPIYIPTLSGSIGLTALVPVLPLIALRLGFSIPAAAGLTIITGIIGVVGPIPIGRLMARFGEQRSLIVTGLGMVASNATAFAIVWDAEVHGNDSAHRWAFLLAFSVVSACGQVWMLGRQAYLGSELPPRYRARGMSTFGGMMRVGQVVGPLLGAAVISISDLRWVYALAISADLLATVLVTVFMVPHSGSEPAPSVRPPGPLPRIDPREASPYGPGRPALTSMVLTTLGITPLMMGRVSRPIILPLLGAALGLPPSTISLMFGIAALIEITMFVPAGTLMDRYGRTAVVVPCLGVMGVGYVTLTVLALTVGGRSHTGAVVALAVSAALVALGNVFGAGILMTLGVDLSPEHARTAHLARWNAFTGVGRLLGPASVSLVTLVAPVAAAGLVTGVLCLAGAGWLLAWLPGVTPTPVAGPWAART